MKITWTRLKGACLLLLGMATMGDGQSFAAGINTQGFVAIAEKSSEKTAAKTEASPFKDESVSASVRAVPVESAMPTCSPSWAARIACDSDNFVGAPGRFWFRGEYLNWQTSGSHLPLLVASDDGEGYMPIFGDREIRNGSHEGYRINFGMWLDCTHCWGLEADYIDVTGRPDNYDSGLVTGNGSITATNPLTIIRPYYGPDPSYVDGPQRNIVGLSNAVTGRVTVETNDYFQSAGLWLRHQLRASEWSTNNGDVNWTDSCARTFRLDAIGGYRFARLVDKVNIHHDETDVSGAVDQGGIGNSTTYIYDDNYRAGNTFNGGELGFNAVYTHGRWSLDVVSKTAIGFNSQYVKMYNRGVRDNRDNVPEPPDVVVQGTGYDNRQVQPFSQNRFSAIPELNVTGGYQITDHVKFTVGYDLLYWSAVVRAADQIPVEPTTGLPYGTQVGVNSTAPEPTMKESHFWAQGLRVGGEYRF
ncbi:MAG: BBP7 family outer membrane beta-barrel protein [Planctomycetota bacterium]